MPFDQLPQELAEIILNHLTGRLVLKCREISKHFLQLIDASIILQLKMELYREGKILNTDFTQESASELLDRLRRTRRAWDTHTPYHGRKLRYKPHFTEGITISEGILSQDIREGERSYTHCEEIFNLSSSKRENWSITYPSFKTRDRFIFPSLDLHIFVVEIDALHCHVHLRTLSTNEPHPSAMTPTFTITNDTNERHVFPSSSVQVSGRYLLLCLGGIEAWGGTWMSLIDWWSGKFHLSNFRLLDVTFIDSTHLLFLTGKGDMRIYVYNVTESQITHALEFGPLMNVDWATFIKAPFSSRTTMYQTPNISLIPQRQFQADTEVDILAIQLSFMVNGGHISRKTTWLVISTAKLLSLISTPHQSSIPSVPWSNWGVQCTRWLTSNVLTASGHMPISGSRMLSFAYWVQEGVLEDVERQWDLQEDDSFARYVISLDFNPRRLSITSSSLNQRIFKDGGRIVEETDEYMIVEYVDPSEWSSEENTGGQAIRSTLPFRAIMEKKISNWSHVMLDGDAIAVSEGNGYREFFSFEP